MQQEGVVDVLFWTRTTLKIKKNLGASEGNANGGMPALRLCFEDGPECAW